MAAILWATAKFTLSPNQKLAVPRKLKRLLLEMAKRTAIERPSIVAAKKVPFPSCSAQKLLLWMLLAFFPLSKIPNVHLKTFMRSSEHEPVGRYLTVAPPAGPNPPELNSVPAVSNTFTPK